MKLVSSLFGSLKLSVIISMTSVITILGKSFGSIWWVFVWVTIAVLFDVLTGIIRSRITYYAQLEIFKKLLNNKDIVIYTPDELEIIESIEYKEYIKAIESGQDVNKVTKWFKSEKMKNKVYYFFLYFGMLIFARVTEVLFSYAEPGQLDHVPINSFTWLSFGFIASVELYSIFENVFDIDKESILRLIGKK